MNEWFGVKLLLRATSRNGKMLYEESVRLVKADSAADIAIKANRLGERILAEYNEDKSFRIATEGEDSTDEDLASWSGFVILDIYQTDLEDSELEDGTEVYSAMWQHDQAEKLAGLYEE